MDQTKLCIILKRRVCGDLPPHLVLAVVFLGVSQDSVAEPEHVLVRGVLLVRQLLQTQQRTFSSSVLEGGLQDPEDLRKIKRGHTRRLRNFLFQEETSRMVFGAHLFENVLFSHQLLSLSVDFAHHHVQNRLPAVDHVGHEENDVLQQLDGEAAHRSRKKESEVKLCSSGNVSTYGLSDRSSLVGRTTI